MGSAAGAKKAAAARVGLALNEYEARLSAGEKWCTACKEWHQRSAFDADRSRGDGLSAKCAASKAASTRGPGARQRRAQRALGLDWCRRCQAWLPLKNVRGGVCKPHANEIYRELYAANPQAISRRNRARKRGLDRVPDWWHDDAFDRFGGLCAYGCGRSADALDHVYPVAHGGQSRPDNLVPACTSCNSSKRDRDPYPWIDRGLLAFPDQWICLMALNYEHAGLLEVA